MYNIELFSLFGIITGFIAGFFGVGGGMILIPMLLISGYNIKSAISISILQMVYTSVFGTIINYQKNKYILKDGIFLGLGGFFGGSLSGYIISGVDEIYLKYAFLSLVIFAILRIYFSKIENSTNKKEFNKLILIVLGFFIGLIAMSLGVGGSVLLTPILVGYMFYSLKEASSLALFFVIFSSISGAISLYINNNILLIEGSTVGIASIIGVYFGIKVKNNINMKYYKFLVLFMYFIILISTIYKLYY